MARKEVGFVVTDDYKTWIEEVKNKIRNSQIKASVRINYEMLDLYWNLGVAICEKQKQAKWGDAFLKVMSNDLQKAFPGVSGFSVENLKHIRYWYNFYTNNEKWLQGVTQIESMVKSIPWGHNQRIMYKCKDIGEALFYIQKTMDNNWSRNVLVHQIESDLYARQGKSINNFQVKLPEPQSDLAEQTLKDPYNFDFLALREEYNERELEDALVEQITQFLLELGTGFSFIGKQIFDTEGKIQPLDYIFSVEILNEGVDIVEVNQVIMLRPTESPIVFIQQLGRGLRKANGKEYVVILDFIGNYNNNFMIPVALSGDRSYNADTIRKYVISGNNTIPGASTVHFDEIAKDRIFASIDKIKGMKSIIRESYVSLKNRLGRVPYLLDFYENGEVDPLVIIKEYKTYQAFLEAVEKELYTGRLNEQEKTTLEYLSKTILSGARPFELEILRQLMKKPSISINEIREIFIRRYDYKVNMQSIDNAADVLQGKFVSKDDEYKRFCRIDILEEDSNNIFHRMNNFTTRLQNEEFKKQIDDIIEVGLKRYHDKYQSSLKNESPFVLYEKYSRRDVSLLMNCGRDLSSTMYGMKRIDDDVFIFVTYHKEESTDEQKSYVDGKPDYADAFEDNMIFRWDSQIGRGVDSSYVSDVVNTKRKHLLVKKSDAESNFYYMGEFDIVDVCAARKRDNNGKERDITKFEMKMHHPVREDLLRYLQSNLQQGLQNNTQEFKAI